VVEENSSLKQLTGRDAKSASKQSVNSSAESKPSEEIVNSHVNVNSTSNSIDDADTDSQVFASETEKAGKDANLLQPTHSNLPPKSPPPVRPKPKKRISLLRQSAGDDEDGCEQSAGVGYASSHSDSKSLKTKERDLDNTVQEKPPESQHLLEANSDEAGSKSLTADDQVPSHDRKTDSTNSGIQEAVYQEIDELEVPPGGFKPPADSVDSAASCVSEGFSGAVPRTAANSSNRTAQREATKSHIVKDKSPAKEKSPVRKDTTNKQSPAAIRRKSPSVENNSSPSRLQKERSPGAQSCGGDVAQPKPRVSRKAPPAPPPSSSKSANSASTDSNPELVKRTEKVCTEDRSSSEQDDARSRSGGAKGESGGVLGAGSKRGDRSSEDRTSSEKDVASIEDVEETSCMLKEIERLLTARGVGLNPDDGGEESCDLDKDFDAALLEATPVRPPRPRRADKLRKLTISGCSLDSSSTESLTGVGLSGGFGGKKAPPKPKRKHLPHRDSGIMRSSSDVTGMKNYVRHLSQPENSKEEEQEEKEKPFLPPRQESLRNRTASEPKPPPLPPRNKSMERMPTDPLPSPPPTRSAKAGEGEGQSTLGRRSSGAGASGRGKKNIPRPTRKAPPPPANARHRSPHAHSPAPSSQGSGGSRENVSSQKSNQPAQNDTASGDAKTPAKEASLPKTKDGRKVPDYRKIENGASPKDSLLLDAVVPNAAVVGSLDSPHHADSSTDSDYHEIPDHLVQLEDSEASNTAHKTSATVRTGDNKAATKSGGKEETPPPELPPRSYPPCPAPSSPTGEPAVNMTMDPAAAARALVQSYRRGSEQMAAEKEGRAEKESAVSDSGNGDKERLEKSECVEGEGVQSEKEKNSQLESCDSGLVTEGEITASSSLQSSHIESSLTSASSASHVEGE
jgi:hypothetical protein